ncbi:MAG: hypothetical protein AABW81_03950 [Nanoarchaeota archaeon]
MLIIKNKRGDLAITLMVFLVITICLASLFLFSTSSGDVKTKIAGAFIVSKAESRGDLAEFYIREAAESSAIKTYDSLIADEKYIQKPVNYNVDGIPEFSELSNTINEDFIAEFNKNFKENFASYEFQEDYLIGLKEIVAKDEFSNSFDGKAVMVKINTLEITSSSDTESIKYIPKISVKVDFKNIGLDYFEDIRNVKNICYNEEQCYNEGLNYFSASINKDVVSLKSKKDFSIGSGFKSIGFSFVPT